MRPVQGDAQHMQQNDRARDGKRHWRHGDRGDVHRRKHAEDDDAPGGCISIEKPSGQPPEQDGGQKHQQRRGKADAPFIQAEDGGRDANEHWQDGPQHGVPDIEPLGAHDAVGLNWAQFAQRKHRHPHESEDPEGGQQKARAVHEGGGLAGGS